MMKTTQFQPKPQQYGYTSYYPTQDTGISSMMNSMMPIIMMVMMMAMIMPMMKGVTG